MPKVKDINKQCDLILQFYHSENENTELSIIFNQTKVNLRNTPYIKTKRFINNEPLQNGELLGSGGMKKVYQIDGKAIFLIACRDVQRLDQIIDEEVSISNQMISFGLKAQALRKGHISIYDTNDQKYHYYPCIVADSFSTLSKSKNIEVYDIKNRLRFGAKYKLYKSDTDCFNQPLNTKIFANLLHDLALLLYLGFEVNEQDSFNLAFMPTKFDRELSTVRLFLYDFSSKYYMPKTAPNPIVSLPEYAMIKRILKVLVEAALEADHIARNGFRPIGRPEFIYHFFQEVYPIIEETFVSKIKKVILEHIRTKNQLEETISPNFLQSKAFKKGYKKFNLYSSAEKVEPDYPKLERSKSCMF